MQNLLEELKKLLEQDERFVVDGKLLKNKIIESALKLDADLIKLLFKSEAIKKHFFQEVDGVLVFDKIKFQKFVSNKAFLPDSYTSFKNKIGLVTENEEYLSESKEVVLAWPYKDCVLEGGMEKEDEKRDEIFYNEILAPDEIDRLLEPKVLTNFKRIDKNGEHKVKELKENDNLIIRGNNLLALHSLKKRFAGKVKLIYIDPPFNREADTFYNDSFKRSSWLTFMRNRLETAKVLLHINGIIFIHIDDKQQSYLKILCDEVFLEDNFVNSISVLSSTPSGVKTAHKNKKIIKTKDYILVYKKLDVNFKPVYKVQNEWDSHYNYFLDRKKNVLLSLKDVLNKEGIYPKELSSQKYDLDSDNFKEFYLKYKDSICETGKTMPEEIREVSLKSQNKNKLIEYRDNNKEQQFAYNGRRLSFLSSSIHEVIFRKGSNFYRGEGISKLLCDFWDDIDFNNTQNEGGISLPAGKKPEMLLHRIIEMVTEPGDIILDFFLGCGTTTAVAHKMGRQYIGVEQLNYGENDSIGRLRNVINGDQTGISKVENWQGGGDFVYCEIMKLNEKYIDEIKKSKTTKELLDIWKKMKEKAFLSYKVDIKQFDENVNEFEQLSIENQKKFLIECLDKNQLYINYSEIDDEEYGVSEDDKKLNKEFYK